MTTDSRGPQVRGRRSNIRTVLLTASSAILLISLAGCGSDDNQQADDASTTRPLIGVTMVEAQTTSPVPATTTATRTTARATLPVQTVEPVEPATADDDYNIDGNTSLETAIAQSGNYTEDQIFSMTVYLAFACDMKDAPELAGFWTPANIATDITDNYGFTITPQTARVLSSGCDDQ